MDNPFKNTNFEENKEEAETAAENTEIENEEKLKKRTAGRN